MGKLKDRYIRFDWAIKRMLRDKANFAVLEGSENCFSLDLLMIRKFRFHLCAFCCTCS